MPDGSSSISSTESSRHLAGTKADPQKARLFQAAKKVVDLTPDVGTEVIGLQLKDLTDDEAEDLALLIAERGVVFFRDQDLSVEQQRQLGLRWGKLNNRVPVGRAGGFDDVQLISVDANSKTAPSVWHQDHSADVEPAAITFLQIRELPDGDVGGDTVWSSLYSAYDKLSPAFRKTLEGLVTLQEGTYYPDAPESYEPARGEQPLVRTHPVTGWRHLYVNGAHVKQIKGFTREESEHLLKYLNDHVSRGVEYQVRWKWTENSIALWDNRSVQHTAIWDYFPNRRVGTRVVVMGDKAYFDPASKSRAESLSLPINPTWRLSIANTTKDIEGRGKVGIKFAYEKEKKESQKSETPAVTA
ncbi:hypothetical protein HK405_011292 [Cladochytrium tenue]|nr:hypothetical protein HK405_011292 [Cladochytrium tenue]